MMRISQALSRVSRGACFASLLLVMIHPGTALAHEEGDSVGITVVKSVNQGPAAPGFVLTDNTEELEFRIHPDCGAGPIANLGTMGSGHTWTHLSAHIGETCTATETIYGGGQDKIACRWRTEITDAVITADGPNTVLVENNYECDTAFSIEKSCDPIPANATAPYTLTCEIEINGGTSLIPGQTLGFWDSLGPGYFFDDDVFDGSASFSSSNLSMQCDGYPPYAVGFCMFASDDLIAAGGSTLITSQTIFSNEDALANGTNCAAISQSFVGEARLSPPPRAQAKSLSLSTSEFDGVQPNNVDCVDINLPVPPSVDLTVVKTVNTSAASVGYEITTPPAGITFDITPVCGGITLATLTFAENGGTQTTHSAPIGSNCTATEEISHLIFGVDCRWQTIVNEPQISETGPNTLTVENRYECAAELEVVKTCDPIPSDATAPYTLDCEIEISGGNGLPVPSWFTLTDMMVGLDSNTSPQTTTGSISMTSGDLPSLSTPCTAVPGQTMDTCTIDTAELQAAGGRAIVNAQVTFDGSEDIAFVTNCAMLGEVNEGAMPIPSGERSLNKSLSLSGSWIDTSASPLLSCVDVPVPPITEVDLSVVKTVNTSAPSLGYALATPPAGASFDITPICGTSTLATATFPASGGEQTLTGAPVGVTCTASETITPIIPNDLCRWQTLISDGVVTPTGAELIVENRYECLAELRLIKNVNQGTAAPGYVVTAPPASATYDISANCDGTVAATMSFPANGGTAPLAPVSVGANCIIAETINAPSDPNCRWQQNISNLTTTAGVNTALVQNTYECVQEPLNVVKSCGDIPADASYPITLECDITVSGNMVPVPGWFALVDMFTGYTPPSTVVDLTTSALTLTPAPPPFICNTVLGAPDAAYCIVNTTALQNAGGSLTFTGTATFTNPNDAEQAVNCAMISDVVDGDFPNLGGLKSSQPDVLRDLLNTFPNAQQKSDSPFPNTPEMSCVLVDLPVETQTAELEIIKEVNQGTASAGYILTTAPANTIYEVTADCGNGTSFTQSFPFSGGSANVGNVPIGSSCVITETISTPAEPGCRWQQQMTDVTIGGDINTAYVQNTYECLATPIRIEKTCGEISADASYPITLECEITVSGNDFPVPGWFDLGDLFYGVTAPNTFTNLDVTAMSMSPQPPLIGCQYGTGQNGLGICGLNTSDLQAAGGTLSFDASVTFNNPEDADIAQNCAFMTLVQDGKHPRSKSSIPPIVKQILGDYPHDCVDIKLPDEEITPTESDIEIVKTLEPIGNGEGLFTLRPDVTLGTLQNGPLYVTDDVPAGMELVFGGSSDWACSPTSVQGPAQVACEYIGGNYPISAGDLAPIEFKARFEPGVENCASVVTEEMDPDFNDMNGDNNSSCVTTPYEPKKTQVRLIKQVNPAGSVPAASNYVLATPPSSVQYPVNLTCRDSNGAVVATYNHTFPSTGGAEDYFGIPAGTTCVANEGTLALQKFCKWETSISPATGVTVLAGAGVGVTVTNVFSCPKPKEEKDGEVRLIKRVNPDSNPPANAAYSVTTPSSSVQYPVSLSCTDSNGNAVANYNHTFPSTGGAVSYAVPAGATCVASEGFLPLGVNCRWDTNISPAAGVSVPAGTSVTVEIANTYSCRLAPVLEKSFDVIKEIDEASAPIPASTEFLFDVTGCSASQTMVNFEHPADFGTGFASQTLNVSGNAPCTVSERAPVGQIPEGCEWDKPLYSNDNGATWSGAPLSVIATAFAPRPSVRVRNALMCKDSPITFTKTCAPNPLVIPDAGYPGYLDCQYTISGQNLTPGEVIEFGDFMTRPGSSHGVTVNAADSLTPGVACTLSNNASDDIHCETTTDAVIAAGGMLSGALKIVIEYTGITDLIQNCIGPMAEDGTSTGTFDANACVSIPVIIEDEGGDSGGKPKPNAGAAKLDITKVSLEACAVNRSAQTYTCDFGFDIANSGDAAYNGPLIVSDSFTDGPPPRSVKLLEGEGWSCPGNNADAASCLKGVGAIDVGGTDRFRMQVTLPGLRDGGQFCSRTDLGLGEGAFLRTIVVQEAMRLLGVFDGTADGIDGPQTQRGVRALQNNLGLPQTGQIDEALLLALGVPTAQNAQSEPVCVQLPKMPPPPLQCDGRTAKNVSDSECACIYKSMTKSSKTSCSCTASKVFKSGTGCVDQPRDLPRSCAAGLTMVNGECATVLQAPARCDDLTTVKRGDACACRYQGMRQTSRLQCSCPAGSKLVPGKGCL